MLAALLLVVLVWLVAYPLVLVLVEGVREPGGWTLRFVRAFLARPTEWQALWGSLWISVVSVLLAGGHRYPAGIPVRSLRAAGPDESWAASWPCRRCSRRSSASSRSCSSTARRASPRCWCSASCGLTDPPWRLAGRGGDPAGARLLDVRLLLPLRPRGAPVASTAPCWKRRPALGAGRWRTLWRIVLPQLRPALGGAALLTFMTSLASFSAPYIFGGGFRVMPTQIVATRLNGDDRLAMVETISLTLLALAALWLFRGTRIGGCGGRTEGRRSRADTGTTSGHASRARGPRVGAGGHSPAAASDPAARLARADRHLDHGAVSPGLHPAELSDAGAGPGSRPAARQQPLARGRRDSRGRGDRARGRARQRAEPGPRRTSHRNAARAAVGGARHRVRDRAGHRLQRAGALGRSV